MRYSKNDLDALRASTLLSAVIGRKVKLRRAGAEFVGLCPFHEENTPSFRVNDDKGLYYCFGCGAGGDVIRFLMDEQGLSFPDAVRALSDEAALPAASRRDPIRTAAKVSAQRQAAIEDAKSEWRGARPVRGTPAELYLASRGITGPFPWSVKFGRVPLWRNRETGAIGRRTPTLLLAAQNQNGAICGIQHIFLTEDGRKLPRGNAKRSLGQIRGCAVRLSPPARRIILVEGPEDGLTLRLREDRVPIWITLGTGMMPFVELPPIVEHVTLAGDNNAPGRAAVNRAEEHFLGCGITVDTMFPPPRFEDWNDELLEKEMASP